MSEKSYIQKDACMYEEELKCKMVKTRLLFWIWQLEILAWV